MKKEENLNKPKKDKLPINLNYSVPLKHKMKMLKEMKN